MIQVKELSNRYRGVHALEGTLARSLSLLELDLASDCRLVACSRDTLRRIGLGADCKAGVLHIPFLALGLPLAYGTVLSALATPSFQHRGLSGRSCLSQA
ncbi:MAG: hypothetical protein ACP5JJ_19580, partial [Anaerolineae bacterium]